MPGDLDEQISFYTRNGELLDVVFTNLMFDTPEKRRKDDIYSTIGLHSVGEHVHVNFGKEPFRFDLEY
jgi:Ran-binding protein 9/10